MTAAEEPAVHAVIFIHGVGDQTPGSSVRTFLDGLLGGHLVWAVDRPAPYISSRDEFDTTLELRRLHVWADLKIGRPETDFFELYWADLMPALTAAEAAGWLRALAKRPYRDMPPQMRPLWLLSRIAAVVVGLVVLALVGIYGYRQASTGLTKVLSFGPLAVAYGLLRGTINSFLRSSLGDAARYLSPLPNNVAARSHIRERGLTLLNQLHRDGRYSRIVVVGHSLGSVIAYDIVTLYWTDRRAGDLPWLVSDLITLGSPLAHAQLLMADSPEDLRRRQIQRELATCPPLPDVIRPNQRPTVPDAKGGPRRRVLHSGAVFGSTRWHNLFFPVTWGFLGDPVGGPVAPAFGHGVVDLPVTSDLGFIRTRTPRAHSSYWRPSKGLPPPRDSNETLRKLLGFALEHPDVGLA